MPLNEVMYVIAEETHRRIHNPIENIEQKSVLDEPVSAVLVQRENNIETPTPVEYVAAPMHNKDNVITGTVIIIHDESVQRSLNRQLTFHLNHV